MLPVICLRCNKEATVVIETTSGTQQTNLCAECSEIVITSHAHGIWRVKEHIQHDSKENNNLENTIGVTKHE